jgi:hypothetical protein
MKKNILQEHFNKYIKDLKKILEINEEKENEKFVYYEFEVHNWDSFINKSNELNISPIFNGGGSK